MFLIQQGFLFVQAVDSVMNFTHWLENQNAQVINILLEQWRCEKRVPEDPGKAVKELQTRMSLHPGRGDPDHVLRVIRHAMTWYNDNLDDVKARGARVGPIQRDNDWNKFVIWTAEKCIAPLILRMAGGDRNWADQLLTQNQRWKMTHLRHTGGNIGGDEGSDEDIASGSYGRTFGR